EPIEKQPEAPEDRPSDGLKMKKSKEEKSLRDEPKKAAKGNKGKEEKSRVNMSDIVLNQSPPKRKKTEPDPKAEQFLAERQDEQSEEIRYSEQFPQVYAEVNAEPPKISQVSIKKAEKFFRGARRSKKDLEVARVGGGAKKYFIFFISLFIFLAALAAAYFLLPKATLALQAKNQTKSVALDLTAAAQNSANASGNALRANLEQTNKDFAEDFEVTGSKDGGAKAAGQVVIYNEFSSADQPLIATTRLETSDGKIFRITKDVVVPGSTNVGGETKPGAIGVDVVADQPGDSFNIDPSDFKISGFKSTPAKFDKFYAKSTKAMAGGSAGAAKAVTAQDIASAREKIAADAKKAAIQELKSSLPPGRKIFEDSVQVAVSNISVSDTVGVQKDKLSATAKIQASALSFEESDVKDLMKNSLVQSGASQNEISFDQPINYVISDSNIQQKTLKFQAATDARIGADLDLDNFKKGILGKTEEDAQIYAKNFPAIQKMDISFWPFFVKRLPLSEGRIEITTN
ncbi:MAG TPA: hypothetical protein VK254_04870, partial [Candidatus Bathyarchaeia archaeon]|nr:hypothetical protein [Candidatus Bathyarchaeia archaeon]